MTRITRLLAAAFAVALLPLVALALPLWTFGWDPPVTDAPVNITLDWALPAQLLLPSDLGQPHYSADIVIQPTQPTQQLLFGDQLYTIYDVFQVVPEPGTAALLVIGLMGLFAGGRPFHRPAT